MGDLTPISGAHALPAMIDRAAKALTDARTHGEVLEAQHIAGAAYDVAKRLGRIARAKDAHDNLIAQVYRAQAGALAIEARAKARLADEYDAAQERGEVAGHGGGRVSNVPDRNNAATVEDLGLSHKHIHDARHVRDCEAADPGVFERTAFGMADAGIEPTKARVNAEIAPAKHKPKMDPKALWLWGRLKDFERDGILQTSFAEHLQAMTPEMRADAVRLAPKVAAFLLHERG
jgi:hypothetical protein